MKAKSTILAAAAATVLSAGMADEASAGIYARSYLAIDDLIIVISDNGGTTPGGAAPKSFSFNLSNTADLNGNTDAAVAACSGLPGIPGPGTNNCGTGPNTGIKTPGTALDERAVNAATGAPVRANNDFTYFGPGANQYSNADSVIYTAQLTQGVPTSTEQIAESELQGGTSASAISQIQSTTGFIFNFTVVGTNQIDISFLADSSRFAQISDFSAIAADAKSNMEVEFKLSKDDGTAQFVWRPNGNTDTGAGGTPGLVGTELFDDFDLQLDYNVTTLPVSCDGADLAVTCPPAQFGATRFGDKYQLLLEGLTSGDWTLGLSATTSTSLARTIPEPSTLALVGMTLAGLGLASRRRKQS